MRKMIIHFLGKFKNTSFFDITTLVSGNVAAQVLSLALYPILTRIYSPEDFGLFGAYLSIVVITSTLFTLQFYIGIPIPSDEKEAINLRKLSLISSFLFTGLVFGVVYFFEGDIYAYQDNNYLFTSPYIFLLPVYLLFISINESYKFWFIRKKVFVADAHFQIITRGVANLIKLVPLVILFKELAVILVMSEVLSQIIATIYWRLKFGKVLRIDDNSSFSSLKKTFTNNKDLPTAQTLNSFLEIALDYFPIVVFGKIFGAREVGYLLLTQKIAIQPCVMVGRSISNVFLEKFSRGREVLGKNYHMILGLAKYSFGVGFLAYLGIFAFAQFDLSRFFGAKWDGLAEVMILFSLIVITRVTANPLSKIFLIYKRTGVLTFFKLCHFLINIILIMRFAELKFFDLFKIYILAEIIFDLIYIFTAFLIVRSDHKESLKDNENPYRKILFLHGVESSWVDRDREILEEKYDLVDLKLNKKGYMLQIFKQIEHLATCDLVYIWFGSIVFFPIIILSKLLGKKIVIVAGGYDVAKTDRFRHGAFDRGKLYQFFIKLNFRLADKIICVSLSNKNEAQKNALITNEKIVYIPLGFAFENNSLKPYSERENTIVMISSADQLRYKIKGVDKFCELAKYLPEYKFKLVGNVAIDTSEIIYSQNIENLELVGYLEFDSFEFNNLLNSSKFITQLSFYESFGAAVVDGAIRGCYPIVTDQFALNELIENIGIKVKYDDMNLLAEKIKRLDLETVSALDVSNHFASRYSLNLRKERILNLIDLIL